MFEREGDLQRTRLLNFRRASLNRMELEAIKNPKVMEVLFVVPLMTMHSEGGMNLHFQMFQMKGNLSRRYRRTKNTS